MFTALDNTMDTYSLNLSGWNTSDVTDMSVCLVYKGADEWEIIGINGWNVKRCRHVKMLMDLLK